MIEAVLFDMGDTLRRFEVGNRVMIDAVVRRIHSLIDEHRHMRPDISKYLRTMRRAMLAAKIKSKLTRREIQVGAVLRAVHHRLGIHQTEEQLEAYLTEGSEAVLEFIRDMPGATETLQQLREAGYKLGIVSNTMFPGNRLDKYLKQESLFEYFDVRIYSSEVGYMKPHRRIFEVAIEGLGVEPRRTVFVGDRLDNDVWGASRLGMQTILIAPNGPRRLKLARPDYVVRSLMEIPPILAARKD